MRSCGWAGVRRARICPSRAAGREVDPRESAPILRRYVREVPITRPYFDATPESSLDDSAAAAPRHPVFELLTGD